MKKEKIFKEIPDWLIINSFRYVMGRSSCQVQTTCEWLYFNWDYFNENTKAIIFRDLKREIQLYEKDNNRMNLGMELDIQLWYWLFHKLEPKI